MRKGYKLLFAAGLLAAAALTTTPAGATGIKPQHFLQGSKNSVGQTFWFPALYGGDAISATTTIYVTDGNKYKEYTAEDPHEAFEELVYEADGIVDLTADGEEYGDFGLKVIEPTSGFSYKLKITKAASADGKTPGEVTIESAELAAGFFVTGGPRVISIPEFVWATLPGSTGGEVKYLVYKVTKVAPTVLDFLVEEEETSKSVAKLKKFYFNSTAKRDDGTIIEAKKDGASGFTDYPLDAIAVTPAVPAFEGALKFHGVLAPDAEIRVLPTRLADVGGSAWFDGWVTDADKVAGQLNFGKSADARDKKVSKTDLERIVTAVSSQGYGAVAQYPTAPRFNYKASNLKLYFEGALTGDKVSFTVAIEDGAFTAIGLGDAFASFNFEKGLTGDLGKAGFGELTVTYAPAETTTNKTALEEIVKDTDRKAGVLKYVKGFSDVSFSGDNQGGDGKGNFTLTGEGLFAGHHFELLVLPDYIKEIGKEWFKGSTISALTGTTLPKVTVIDEEAFAGATIPVLSAFGFGGTNASATDIYASKSAADPTLKTPLELKKGADGSIGIPVVITIGKAAFKGAKIGNPAAIDISALKWATNIGDEAFAGIKQYNATAKNWMPITGIQNFGFVETLGKDVFKGDTLHWDASLKATAPSSLLVKEDLTNAIILKLPFEKYLTTVPANIFKDVVLVDEAGAVKVVHLNNDETKEKIIVLTTITDVNDYIADNNKTIAANKFVFEEKGAAKSTMDKDALYDATVYVDYTAFEGWKKQLEGSVVKAYGVGVIGDPKVKLITSLGKTVGGVDVDGNPVETNIAKFVISYGFNDDGKSTRILSFAAAIDADAAYYRIDGPATADGLFTEDLGKSHEIGDDIKENGIVLAGGIPAGLYIIKTGTVTQKEAKDIASVLYVAPIDLELVKIDTLTRTYVGEENLEALLSGIKLSDITVRDLYDEDDIKLVTSSDVRLFPVADAAPTVGATTEVIRVRGLGNYTGEAPVYLKYEALDLSKATITLDDVEFTGSAKYYGYPEDGKVTVKSHGFDVTLTQEEGEDNSVKLGFTAPAKIGKVDVTVTANPKSDVVIGSGKTSYTVQALWSKIASVNEKVGYHLGDTVYFNGLPKTFDGLVTPIYLEEGDYSLVAIPAIDGTLYYVDSLGEYIENELKEVGDYDFYIIPASEEYKTIYAGKKNATLVGTLPYMALPFEELKGAFEITLDDAKEYVLTLDENVYAGEYNAELNTAKTAFTVTLPEEVLAGIEGLEEPTFEIAIPTALPTELHFDQPVKTLHEGESYDLAQHLIPNEGAKLDFLNDIEWTSSKDTKFTVDETGFITAIEEWEGTVTATVKGTDVSATIDIHVILEDEDVPTSVVAAAAAKGVTYADGKLTVKGYAGQTAKLYRLNGTTAAQVKVTSDAATFDVKLAKGFYLVKTGSAITKIVVR